ncbi:MAG: hypothetical protein C7B43_04845 [Sulfobacillus benefaciens]|uniref:Uncharacterized protein n=1 Tax=Sulfobacillus benefaciens TaxID=453960 RepID=A0A2T2X8J2_9FIRM|nr:MAG: hypothetical protein C7B43_04845 [Sulfobacillus benefaciens]
MIGSAQKARDVILEMRVNYGEQQPAEDDMRGQKPNEEESQDCESNTKGNSGRKPRDLRYFCISGVL